MKFVIQFVLIALISWAMQSFLPWWSVIIVAFIVSLISNGKSGLQAFLAGFLAILVLWAGYALMIDSDSGGILTDKIARILTINDKYLLILATGIVGGLPSGFGALTGNLLAKVFQKNEAGKYYS